MAFILIRVNRHRRWRRAGRRRDPAYSYTRGKSNGVQNNSSRSINTIRHSVLWGARWCSDAYLFKRSLIIESLRIKNSRFHFLRLILIEVNGGLKGKCKICTCELMWTNNADWVTTGSDIFFHSKFIWSCGNLLYH